MGKKLAPMIAMLAMLAPVATFALGLGDITMKSALNQPLDAEIELLSVEKGDIDDLRVRLGSADDFARVGAERTFFLTKLKFEVAKRPDGTPYVHLTTRERVTEPFLDFVVEARWPRGRILREYTVLVDPPLLTEEAPAPIQQATTSSQAAPAAVSTARPAPIPSRARLSPVQSADGVLSYGPVRPNDTLWEIANRMRPDDSVTVNQMMLALVRENPQAFYNGNVNQLKAGYVLRIEDPAAIAAVPAAQADAEIERQRAEWEARRSGRPLRQVAGGTGTGEAGVSAAGGGAAAGTQARLKLVAPGSEGVGSGTGDAEVERLRQDLVLAAEALDANRQETEELKQRLAQMEEQLAAMQRLIMLKDDEMLALQKQLAGEAPEAATDEEPAAAGEAEGVVPEAPVEAAAPAEETPPSGEAAGEQPAPAAKPAPAPEPAPEEGLLDNPLVLYGGLGVVLLAIVGLLLARRRKMQEGFQESILNVDGADAGGVSEMPQGGGDSSALVSDFAMSEISDMDGIQTESTEVDPLAEADVYLAYGRHQQAEEIIRSALEKEPERRDYKLKLLEVFFAAKDAEGFGALAQEFHDEVGDESDADWIKVAGWGAQLSPDNPLFGAAADAAPATVEEAAQAEDDGLLDFDFDLDAPTAEAKDSEALDAELDAALEDMDLGDDAATAEKASPDDTAVLDFDVSSLDFNLGDSAGDGGETAAAEAAGETAEGGLDFDMESLGTADETAEDPNRTQEVPVDELALPEGAEEAEEEIEIPMDSGDELDLDLDLQQAADEASLEITPLDEDEVPEEIAAAVAGDDAGKDDQADSGEDAIEFTLDEETADDQSEGIDFDMELDEATVGDDEVSIEFDVAEDAGSEPETETAEGMAADEQAEPAEAGTEPSGSAIEEAGTEDELTLAGETDEEEDLLDDDIFGDVDEIGTKLDLAKAYVDMGDADGARSILDEVLEDGDEAQKEQAKALLEQIG